MTVRVEQLQSRSLRDQALAVIRQRMVTGEIAPGEIYSASAIASTLGVSNSPVREAMLTLVEQGMMEPVRNRGFRVVPLSNTDRNNIHQLRLILEVSAMGQIAAAKLAKPKKAEFKRLVDDMIALESNGDYVGFLEADRDFHLGLLSLLGNTQLTSIVGNLRDQTRLFGLLDIAEKGLLAASAKEHRAILEAMVKGDSERTERLMTEHLEHVRKHQFGDVASEVPPAV
ncbi:GntR family transcriptional regulator [Rhodococcus sp. 06-156-3C]|uniref:GntR family transcriptional regulator n=1 Tax=Nocardiaceae TaxID=85025 RepID=UPI0006899292|nr:MULTISPECIES: GntR family transcriptional regulator [Rhodococcus]OZD18224.1 GntR family transcriptional regulator [Rhodococcus sp. 06-156-4C]OZD18822.1 GntR family transcriptional regulator [Rhodococcus sp. 06-156-3C]OZD22332.1 GntR family transcriptional regulator [Rhodococcus sp. 06-156-4a]OZD34138.1 GntR family transcriptional regulator [Rhodococcus sp. 06-156-3b]OZD38875.1 GntR family transcriptional regulator [Rhodococcus sp. 06-156-3]